MQIGRLVSLIDLTAPGDCWPWLGFIDRDGYGRYGKWSTAYRAVYEFVVGPVPDGLALDHLCRVRGCVNPAHLEPVTHAENMRRSAPAQATHCINGHAYDAVNTYFRPNGQRDCRACVRSRARAYKARLRERRAA